MEKYKKFNDGSEYNGNFNCGKENVYGEKKWKDGQIYEGNFVNEVKEGKGVHKYIDGQKYEGEFLNGKGTYSWIGMKYN